LDFFKAKKIIKDQIIKFNKEDFVKIIRISVKIEDIDLLTWLRLQDDSEKIYWRDRESKFICAGIGESVSIKGDRFVAYKDLFDNIYKYINISSLGVRFYGGIRFPCIKKDNDRDIWDNFGFYYFLVPLFELIKKRSGTYFVCNIKTPIKNMDYILHKLDTLKIENSIYKKSPFIPYNYRIDIPDKREWEEDIKNIMQDIKNKRLIKVVLARKTIFAKMTVQDLLWALKNV